MSQLNQLCKYADNTTLIISQNTNVSAEDEFHHVVQWSTQNKLTVNFNTTKELTFCQHGLRYFQEPTVIDNIERSNTFKLFVSSFLVYFVHGFSC